MSTTTTVVVGGITKVPNPTCPQIEALARFAVGEFNKKQNATLKFAAVVNAKQQVVAGTIYYITLSAINGCLAHHYEAKVLEKSWMDFKELLEFKLLKPTAH